MSKFIIIPTYSDIFDEEKPSINNLISDIPSKVIISLLAMMNAKLYLDEHNPEIQKELFELISRRFDKKQKYKIYTRLLTLLLKDDEKEEQNEFTLFATKFNLEFIHHELLNYRDFEILDTTPQQEVNFLKAYWLIVEKVTNEYGQQSLKIKEYNQEDFFIKKTWSLIIAQFSTNQPQDPIFQIIRAISFLNFLQKSEKYSQYHKNFLTLNNKDTSWDYVLELMNLFTQFLETTKDKMPSFSINSSPNFSPMLESFCMDINVYQKNTYKHRDYIGIKEKPLLRYYKKNYCVLNWNFFISKLYDGLLRDFFNRSGIKQEFSNKYINFKSDISEKISEKFVFNKLINACLSKKYEKLLFNPQSQYPPDCYYRKRKFIFLFEFKDIEMSVQPISSYSFDDLKKEIDKKLVTPKGVKQLINQIKELSFDSLKDDNYIEKGIKKKNIVIFPIIVYTDRMFGIPGINNYLNGKFRSELEKLRNELKYSTQNLGFQKIHDLVLINLKIFAVYINRFKDKSLDLKELIEYFYIELLRREKKEKHNRTTETLFNKYESFEYIVSEKIKEKFYDNLYYSRNSIKELFNILDLGSFLPKN